MRNTGWLLLWRQRTAPGQRRLELEGRNSTRTRVEWDVTQADCDADGLGRDALEEEVEHALEVLVHELVALLARVRGHQIAHLLQRACDLLLHMSIDLTVNCAHVYENSPYMILVHILVANRA